MKKKLFQLLIVGMVACWAGSATATTISYQLVSLGGTTYEEAFSVTNDTLTVPINEIQISFDYGLYAYLEPVSSGSITSAWFEQTFDPRLSGGTPQPGLYDASTTAFGIAPGTTLSGFSVKFEWLGAPGTLPDGLSFTVFGPTLDVLDSGTSSPTSAVPEPGSLLLCTGFLCIFGLRRAIIARSHLNRYN